MTVSSVRKETLLIIFIVLSLVSGDIGLINIIVAVFPGNVAAFKALSNTKYIRFEVRKPKSDFWHF